MRHFRHPAFRFLSVFVRGTGWDHRSRCLASDRTAGLGCAGQSLSSCLDRERERESESARERASAHTHELESRKLPGSISVTLVRSKPISREFKNWTVQNWRTSGPLQFLWVTGGSGAASMATIICCKRCNYKNPSWHSPLQLASQHALGSFLL